MTSISRGLGKGLDSMIPKKENKKIESNNVSRETLLNINIIEPNKNQPRKDFNEDALHELAESIKIYGIIQPLVVQKEENYYRIIAGERRWRAAKIAGLKEVPVIVKNYSSKEIVEIALIENIQREDLNPIEEALAYQNLITEYNLRQDEVANRVSKSRAAITNAMRLLKLDPRVQQMLIDDMLTSGHARAILSIADGEKQFKIATQVFDEKLSVRETEKLVKNALNTNKKEVIVEPPINTVIYRDIENNIKSILGSKVQIKQKDSNSGKIQIDYYSSDELERIYDLLRTIKNNN